jgi:hypothetical protein
LAGVAFGALAAPGFGALAAAAPGAVAGREAGFGRPFADGGFTAFAVWTDGREPDRCFPAAVWPLGLGAFRAAVGRDAALLATWREPRAEALACRLGALFPLWAAFAFRPVAWALRW